MTKAEKINILDRRLGGKLATITVPIDRSISLEWTFKVIKSAVAKWAKDNNRKAEDLAWDYVQ